MRIAFFVWEYPPRLVGGLGTYAYEITKQYVKLGHDVTVFTMNDGSLKTKEEINGVEVHRPLLIDLTDALPEALLGEFRDWIMGTKFFSDIFLYNVLSASKLCNELVLKDNRQYDVVSVHDWLSVIAGISSKRSLNLPMVFHVHSTERGRTLGNGLRIIEELEAKGARYANAIITVSHAMANELRSLGFPEDKLYVVWNGVDPSKYNPKNISNEERENLRMNYGLRQEDPMILFIGRLIEAKGVDRLVKAMAYVSKESPKTKLVIVGKGPMLPYLIELARSLKIDKNVIFRAEMLPEKDRILHYAAADICVFPSLYEPFGIVALEALSMEKPVVVGERGTSGLGEIVIPSGRLQCGIHVNPYNPMDIAQAIIDLINNPDLRLKFGKNGRRRIIREFTWEKAAERTLRIYQKVISEK